MRSTAILCLSKSPYVKRMFYQILTKIITIFNPQATFIYYLYYESIINYLSGTPSRPTVGTSEVLYRTFFNNPVINPVITPL